MLDKNYGIILNFIVVHSFSIRNICLIKVLLTNEPIYNFPN